MTVWEASGRSQRRLGQPPGTDSVLTPHCEQSAHYAIRLSWQYALTDDGRSGASQRDGLWAISDRDIWARTVPPDCGAGTLSTAAGGCGSVRMWPAPGMRRGASEGWAFVARAD